MLVVTVTILWSPAQVESSHTWTVCTQWSSEWQQVCEKKLSCYSCTSKIFVGNSIVFLYTHIVTKKISSSWAHSSSSLFWSNVQIFLHSFLNTQSGWVSDQVMENLWFFLEYNYNTNILFELITTIISERKAVAGKVPIKIFQEC